MASRGIVFLMYHELELPGRALCQFEPGYVRYILLQDSFREQMNWLRKNSWRGLSVGEALDNPPGNSVAITFDDGSETDLLAAAPILKENGFTATFYVTTGFIGKPGYMSPDQLRELSSLGFEIGCHSMTHPYLNELDPAGLQYQIVEARDRLQQICGAPVRHFSCPGGRYSELVISTARQAGYSSFATSDRHVNLSSTDHFRLGRVAVLRDTKTSSFQKICQGQGLWKMQLSDSGRALAKTLLGNSGYDRLRALLLGDRFPDT